MAVSSSTTRIVARPPPLAASGSALSETAVVAGAAMRCAAFTTILADRSHFGKVGSGEGLVGSGRRAREIDPELGAARGRAVDFNPAVVILDDSVADRQAEAGPLSLILGGEKRLEDLLAIGGRDP